MTYEFPKLIEIMTNYVLMNQNTIQIPEIIESMNVFKKHLDDSRPGMIIFPDGLIYNVNNAFND
jgi:hypothetical protein